MELNEQTIAALKEKFAQALEQERTRLLAFAGENRASAEDIYRELLAQAEQTRGIYPKFDLVAEAESPEFMTLLATGLPMHRCFETVHHDELVDEAMLFALSYAQKGRPAENGLSSQAAAAAPGSMASSTRQQREEIRTRVSRGEKVKL